MKNKGTITPALLIVTGAFIVVIYGLIYVLTTQLDFSHRQVGSEMAIDIAEAGANYYRWHLAHAPADFKDGTGNPGPYVHSYKDPEGAEIGKYSLDITAPVNGSSIVKIKSTGWSDRYPTIKRTIVAQYGKPSFAKYLFLSNASSWYGSGITVNGAVHSNNGIRMDGVNNSIVESAVATYTCGTETGCSPSKTMPGVWGSGPNSNLWQFPVTSVDFNSVSVDFANMKTAAQSSGLYLGPSGALGYHLIFAANGTFTVKKVTATSSIYSYLPNGGVGANDLGGCRRRNETISTEQTIGTYNVSDKPIIFSEDYLWVEGVVNGRTEVVAAGFPVQTSHIDIWIPNNITYPALDGTSVLGLIAQNDIIYTRNIPTNFIIDAVLMAQGGQVIRGDYAAWCQGTSTGAVKNSLTINGALISYNKSYWNFNSPPESGFTTRTINYDPNILYAPPPYFPTSSSYQFISWSEQ
ncbi:hypothetical protein HYS03_01500 [Candidatus Woesebacteria bacterium]|nr:hypothetical protein [Candidatus Woesebacteria bacterium]QQG47942.1 MAG: hypothetical protein HY044_02545 [Candidatus Woesebacteria bacterium]